MSDISSLLEQWQTERSEWHGATTLEVVREYAEWREAHITRLTSERDALQQALAEASEAIDIADNIIAINCGTDTPSEWPRAIRKVANARAKVPTLEALRHSSLPEGNQDVRS